MRQGGARGEAAHQLDRSRRRRSRRRSRRDVAALLVPARSPRFLDDLERFVGGSAGRGSGTRSRARCCISPRPGVPDIYQGDELWNFALVDPDNRRPVDFGCAPAAAGGGGARIRGDARRRDAGFSPSWSPDRRTAGSSCTSSAPRSAARRERPARSARAPIAPLDAAGRRPAGRRVRPRARAGQRLRRRRCRGSLGRHARPAARRPDPALWGDTTLPLPTGGPHLDLRPERRALRAEAGARRCRPAECSACFPVPCCWPTPTHRMELAMRLQPRSSRRHRRLAR